MKLIHPNGSLEAHPLSLAFPEMDDVEFRDLLDSITERGLREDIVLLDGKVLDGRHRYKACCIAGVKPTFVNFNEDIDGKSTTEYVKDKNFTRRHLSLSQRAAVAVKFLPALEKEAAERKAASQFKAAPPAEAPVAPVEPPTNIIPMMPEDLDAPVCCPEHIDNTPAPVVPIVAAAPVEAPAEAPATTPQVTTKDFKGKGGPAAALIAKTFGTSATMVSLAKRIKKADEELFAKVLNGGTTVNEAIQIIEARAKEAEETGKKAIENKERIDALVVLGDRYGMESKVYEAIKSKTILKKHADLLAFTQLTVKKTKAMIPLLGYGWDLEKVTRFLDGKMTIENSLEDLQNIALAQGEPSKEPYVVIIGKWTFTAVLAE